VDTVVQSRSRTVVIGPEQPFCVIGERINPTGRKTFQAQLQAGDLSQLEIDVAQQTEGGADMLDVNVGDPLADEVGLMAQAIPLVQGLTDIPLCIDSSVIEALEAGLDAYEGKALVNSVTGEDERLEAILPIVARHGAAVIALPNEEDEIPDEPQRLAAFMTEAVAKGLAEQCALIPSICLVRSPRALRYMDERVPGITVPMETIERCESAPDPEHACFDVACELAEQARSLPGVAGLHLISFRKEAGIARLCQRLNIPTRQERELSGYRRPVAV